MSTEIMTVLCQSWLEFMLFYHSFEFSSVVWSQKILQRAHPSFQLLLFCVFPIETASVPTSA